MKILNKILYIFLFIASFLLIGITSLFEIGLGQGKLQDPVFYMTQIMTYLAIILVTLGTVYLVIDKFKEKNADYIKADKEIADFAQDKRYIPSFISKFLETTNRKRKIKQFNFDNKKRLYLLTKYKPWYWYLLPWRWSVRKYSDYDVHIWNFGTEEEKANNEYCTKRKFIEEQLDEDFVENNIDKLYVKYDKITESVILGGYYDSDSSGKANEYIETHLSRKIVLHKLPTLLLSFGFTFFLSLIVIETIVFKTNAIVALLVKLVALVWNTFVALRYGKQLCDTTILKDIRFRRGLITEYDKWLIQEASKVNTKQEEHSNGTNEITRTIREDIEVHTDSVQSD